MPGAVSIMANLSAQLGRSITWDPAKQQILNDADAYATTPFYRMPPAVSLLRNPQPSISRPLY